jgi:hypothetical protein
MMLEYAEGIGGGRERTHHKDDAELLGDGPLQGVLLYLVGRVACGGLVILGTSGSALLLDEDIGDEAVDDRGAEGGVRSRPHHHAGGGKNLERVQHGAGWQGRSGDRLVEAGGRAATSEADATDMHGNVGVAVLIAV